MLRITTLLLILLSAQLLQAQPLPCGPTAAMTSFCADACIICDINGFTGINNSNVQGQAPPGFCTTQVHHMQWIAFQAGSTNLTLKIAVSGCQNGNGLEIGIYQTSDCENFTLVSACDTDIPNNTSQNFTNTVPLVIGQYYYLVMDGGGNDICNYLVTVVSGSTQVDPVSTSGAITGPLNACPGVQLEYISAEVPGATEWQWTMDGVNVDGNVNAVEVIWTTEGTHELCVKAYNACSEAPPVCTSVNVTSLPPTTYSVGICPGECEPAEDTLLCDYGVFDFHYTSVDGCDSLVQVTVTTRPATVSNLDLDICQGDQVVIGGEAFTQTGQYQKILTNWLGCDSLVNIDLFVIACEIQGSTQVQGVACAGGATGRITFSVTNGTPPLAYTWQRVGTTPPLTGQGVIENVNTPEILDLMPAGLYFITINDNFGNDLVLIADVTDAEPLSNTFATSNYHGFQVSCNNGSDGTITATAAGGSPPYTYAWADGGQGPIRQNLTDGVYTVTVTDKFNCTFSNQIALNDPTPLVLSGTFTDPGCAGPNTGTITVTGMTGGVGPYQYHTGDGVFTNDTYFTGLPEDDYTLTAQDANGCVDTVQIELEAAHIPVVWLPENTSIFLGETVEIQVGYDVPPPQFSWSETTGFSCTDCLEPYIQPWQTTTYTLVTTSEDGCTASDAITITVKEKRDVYIPNIFTPDDNTNRYLSVFGGPEVTLVKSLRVYSRWGELVFENTDFVPNIPKEGWDGTFRGKDLADGVFIWTAEVEFLDKKTISYSGDCTLAR